MSVASAAPKPTPVTNKPSTWTVLTFSVNIPNPIAPKHTIKATFLTIGFIFIAISLSD